MENHINTLNRMMLPKDFIETALTPSKPLYPDDLGSSQELDPEEFGYDLQTEYLSELEEKKKNLVETIMGNRNIHLDHIGFLNCSKVL